MPFRCFEIRLPLLILAIAACCQTNRMAAQTGDPDTEKNWEQICAKALAQPLTPPTFANVMPESQLKTCDSEALYYGFDSPSDSSSALQCAYYQRAHPNPGGGDPFEGPGVLTMLYANGKGVPRNYDLAIRFACENSWAAEAEMELRIGHLEKLRDSNAASTDFDLCEDGTSGLMEGACESVHQRFADAGRRKQLDAITKDWSPAVRAAFQSVQKAEARFEDARTGNEVDLSGTGRAAFALEEQGRLRDQFQINLRRFAKGDIPAASMNDELKADRRLNDIYRQIQQQPADSWKYGTINSDGIRNTERTWLTLRDTWMKFGRTAYPNLGNTRIRTQLIRLRIHQLESLLPKE